MFGSGVVMELHMMKVNLIDESKLNRRIRGGAWNYSSDFCDILCRNYMQSTFNINYIGFRIVRTI